MDNSIKLLAGGAAAVLLFGQLRKHVSGISGVGAAYNGSYADRVHVLLLDDGKTEKIEVYHSSFETRSRIRKIDSKAIDLGFSVDDSHGEWKRIYTKGDTVCTAEVHYVALY